MLSVVLPPQIPTFLIDAETKACYHSGPAQSAVEVQGIYHVPLEAQKSSVKAGGCSDAIRS